jgi:hypothetical protein
LRRAQNAHFAVEIDPTWGPMKRLADTFNRLATTGTDRNRAAPGDRRSGHYRAGSPHRHVRSRAGSDTKSELKNPIWACDAGKGWFMADAPMRRMSDKVLAAFNQACDEGDADIAEMLLRALELILTREGGANSADKRGEMGAVIEAYSRLLSVKNKA